MNDKLKQLEEELKKIPDPNDRDKIFRILTEGGKELQEIAKKQLARKMGDPLDTLTLTDKVELLLQRTGPSSLATEMEKLVASIIHEMYWRNVLDRSKESEAVGEVSQLMSKLVGRRSDEPKT